MKRAIQMEERDSVATVLETAQKGSMVSVYNQANQLLYLIEASEDIPSGNKIALSSIEVGENVIKYGASIGVCTKTIKDGRLVHVHNVKSRMVDIPDGIRKKIIEQMKIREEI